MLDFLYKVKRLFHISKEGNGSTKSKEAGEENEGRTAATEEIDQQNTHYQQALQIANFQSVNPQCDPLGHATNNQTTKETSIGIRTEPLHGLPPQTPTETQTRCPTIQNESQSGNVAQRPKPTPQTETKVQMQELTGITVERPPQVRIQIENGVQVLQMDREFNISFGVIGLSVAMLGAYFGLLQNNEQISDHMILYEASLWLLYTSLCSGLIMLMITTIRPCTHYLCAFYSFLCLAVVSGTYAISIGIYLLLPKSTIRLTIISFFPTALLLVAMILYSKDKIAWLFQFKQHQN